MSTVDYLVIGQGLAGSSLALEFLKRGVSFLIIDQEVPHSASRVAAGLFNPITGKTMQPTWRAAELFPFLHTWYPEAEQQLQASFFHPLPILRPFISVQEREQWHERKHPFVSDILENNPYPEIQAPYGMLVLAQGGYLDATTFLQAVRKTLTLRGYLMASQFDFNKLNTSQSTYQDIVFKNIIFCDGVGANSNPLFSWVPIKKLKGETFQAEARLPTDVIFNRGVFAVPMPRNNVFTVGSTYTHDPTPGNTETGIAELKAKTGNLLSNGFVTIQTSWGHRPTTPDRRPVLGRHPTYANILIFNGLGTKGVSLAPFFAVQLANHLLIGLELDSAVNIERFYSLSFQNLAK